MIPREFQYHAPKSLPDALGLLKQLGDDAKVLAGGHSLLPMMKLRFAQPAHLIDLGKIAELRVLREDRGSLRIGATTTESDLSRRSCCRRNARCSSKARARSPTR